MKNSFFGILISFLILHCATKSTPPVLKTAAELTAEGWQAFENGDFGLAVVKFDSAVAVDSNFVEAYNGSGWAYGRLGDFSKSGTNFDRVINLDSTSLEVQAGASLAFHALNRFHDSIKAANKTLKAKPNFVFSHDPSIDALDIRITLALSYFSVADFVNAAAQMDIIDPVNSPHSTDPEELIRDIMRFFGQIR